MESKEMLEGRGRDGGVSGREFRGFDGEEGETAAEEYLDPEMNVRDSGLRKPKTARR